MVAPLEWLQVTPGRTVVFETTKASKQPPATRSWFQGRRARLQGNVLGSAAGRSAAALALGEPADRLAELLG